MLPGWRQGSLALARAPPSLLDSGSVGVPKCRRFVTVLCSGDARAKPKPSLEDRLKAAALLPIPE